MLSSNFPFDVFLLHSHDIPATMESSLKIPTIEDYVHLGCSPAERTFSQRVHYSIELKFSNLPEACMSDSMEKTPCYSEITEKLSSISKDKHYATIEHLAYCGLNCVEEYLLKFDTLKIESITFSVHKLNPPVPLIKQGTQFTLTKKIK